MLDQGRRSVAETYEPPQHTAHSAHGPGSHEREPATLAGTGASNVIRTLVRHEDLLNAWLGLAQKLLLSGRVSPRDRELAILRVALRTDCEYEWANHVLGAVAAGATVDEIRALANPSSAAWSDPGTWHCSARSTNCVRNDCVSDDTWAALAATRDDLQLIEILCLIGYYRMNPAC